MQNVRILEIPNCKTATSVRDMFGQPEFDRFCLWLSCPPRSIWLKDFLTGDERGMRWLSLSRMV